MNWENYTDINFADGYNKNIIWSKKESLEYAGN